MRKIQIPALIAKANLFMRLSEGPNSRERVAVGGFVENLILDTIGVCSITKVDPADPTRLHFNLPRPK